MSERQDPEEWQDLLPDPPSAEHYRELADERGHPWRWRYARYPEHVCPPEPPCPRCQG